MDKYAGYVVIVYVVTLALLAGYLGWIWLRLRASAQDEAQEQSLAARPAAAATSERRP